MTSHIYGEELNPYSFVSSPSFPSLPSSAFSLLFHILSFSFPWEIIALVNKHIGSIFTQGLSFPLSLDANQDNNYNSSQTIINKKQTRTYTVILPPPQKKYIGTAWGYFAYHPSTIWTNFFSASLWIIVLTWRVIPQHRHHTSNSG